ncbi:Alpha/Beta hydrolase protein [Aspergillus aurantiobrunneus]
MERRLRRIPAPTAIPALISIGSHSLSASISGPSPSSGPLVVFCPGAADVASSYVAVERLLRPSAPVLLYDRSGLGRSQKSPLGSGSSAVKAAGELKLLLRALGVTAPVILVGHSYGGVVAREFLHLFPADVAGMVLCDAATERSSEFFTVPDMNILAVLGGLNFARVTGLRGDTVLDDDEWRIRAREISTGHEAAQAEASSFVEVCETLKTKEQFRDRALGDRPLSVIHANSARDYERIYEKGVEAGNGTVQQRREFRELLDRWEDIDRGLQEEQLLLSETTHYVRLEDCRHNVHLVRPEVIVQEVQWVRDKIIH